MPTKDWIFVKRDTFEEDVEPKFLSDGEVSSFGGLHERVEEVKQEPRQEPGWKSRDRWRWHPHKMDHKILLNRLVYWLWIVIVHPDLHINLIYIYIYSIHYRTSVGCDSMLWMFICQLHASLLWTSFMIQFFLQIGLKVLKGKILLSWTCHPLVHLVQVDCAQYLSGHWSLANSAVHMAVVLLPNYSQPKRYCNTPSSSIWKIEGFLSAIISRQLRKRMTWV